ncbi:MAG TPA: hypothetical protein VF533_00680, partial [Solirubrobacteraceae bacterium]
MRATVAVVLVLLVLGPGAARGQAVTVDAREPYPTAGGPVLTGDGVAYLEEAGTFTRVRIAARGRHRDAPLVTPERDAPP